jgi:glutamate-1-semialdehyde aminotransferase
VSVAGFTSTGSKHPQLLFGTMTDAVPLRMIASHGCHVTADDGRDYLDCIMALGAVAVGYGHESVRRAVIDAVEHGGIGPLAPVQEELLAAELAALMPALEQVRFLKSGAEAAAAAVRLARTLTGRDEVIGCGYHGWLDWCSTAGGVPEATRALYTTIPFNDSERSVATIRAAGDRLACVVLEPVIERSPDREWLLAVRNACHEVGALLIFDEIKTAFRVAIGGAQARWNVEPDLTILGKAFASGFPLAAVGGRRETMAAIDRTWISSTMATEWVSIAAARATLGVMVAQQLPAHLHQVGGLLLRGLRTLAEQHGALVESASGIEEMCYLRFRDDTVGRRVATGCAARGLLFKSTAYNFVSLAHGPTEVERALDIVGDVLRETPC